MKQILHVLTLVILISAFFASCKEDRLEVMHDNEVSAREKYIKDNNLEQYRDSSGIYIRINQPQSSDSSIVKGYKVMLQYNIFLLDSTKVLTTENSAGQTMQEDAFFVDVSNEIVNQNYVQKIAGMHIGLKKMRIGDRAFMVIPSELAYKAVDLSGTIGIPRFSTLVVYVYAKKGYSPYQQQNQ